LADTRGEVVTLQRQYRQARPELLRRRRVSIVGESVEREVRHRYAVDVLLIGNLVAEQDSVGRYARVLELALDVGLRVLVQAHQPQQAFGGPPKDVDPYRDRLGRDLPVGVERGEDERVLRKLDLVALNAARTRASLGTVRLIDLRQP